jgi:hypothetical protein
MTMRLWNADDADGYDAYDFRTIEHGLERIKQINTDLKPRIITRIINLNYLILFGSMFQSASSA